MSNEGWGRFSGTERFEICRKLGAGGMGVVYEAIDRARGGNRVALKTLQRVDATGLYRFKREFRALQDIEHPNLVALGELFEDSGEWFFTMELVPGVDFMSHVCGIGNAAPDDDISPSADTTRAERVVEAMRRGTSRADPTRLRAALIQLAHGLVALHEAGKVHRDVKPSNIRVTPDGRVVLLDFGLIAERASDRASTNAHAVGTAAYMAPEQAASDTVGPAADWYSVGIMIYEALAGRLPFEGAALAVMLAKQTKVPPPLAELAPDAPRDLVDLATELLAFDPARRPTGADVLRRLGKDGQRIEARESSRFTRSSVFFGRDSELSALRERFLSTRKGQAAAALLVGESGVGKSMLARSFTAVAVAESHSTVVLHGRCYERESVPFKAFDGVVDALARFMRGLPDYEVGPLTPRNAALLVRLFPILGRVETFAQAPQPLQLRDNQDVRTLAFDALRELMFLLAERRPVVLVIDDLQWADADSWLLMRDLMRDPDPPPILVIGTARPSTETLERWSEVRSSAVIGVGPLADDDAKQLALALLAQSDAVDPAIATAIADEARGHPLYIDELVRHAIMTGTSGHELALDDAIWERVSNLPAEARLLLELACTAAVPLPREVLRQAAKLESDAFHRNTGLLRVASLIRAGSVSRSGTDIEPYHDRVREAVLNRIARQSLIERHERVAIALQSSDIGGERPELLSRHFEGAGQPARAAAYAQTAAARAEELLAFEQAAQLYADALRLGDHSAAERRRLLIRRGDALAAAGFGPDAAEIFVEASEGADEHTRLQCLRKASEFLLKCGYLVRGSEIFASLLHQLGGRLPRTPKAAFRSLIWNRIRIRLRGYSFKSRPESAIPPQELALLDIYRGASRGLAFMDFVGGGELATRALLMALRVGEPNRAIEEITFHGSTAMGMNKRSIERGLRLTESVREEANRDPDSYLSAFHSGNVALLMFYAGRYREALELLDRSESIIMSLAGLPWESAGLHLFQALTHVRVGSVRDLERTFGHIRNAELRGDRLSANVLRMFSYMAYLARDRPDLARIEVHSDRWEESVGRPALQSCWHLVALSNVLLYDQPAAGLTDEVRRLFEAVNRTLVPRAVAALRTELIAGRARITLADALGGDKLALREVRRSIRLLQRAGLPYPTACAHLLDAALANGAGDSSRAIEELRAAQKVADEVGMFFESSAARRTIGTLLGGDEGRELIAEADSAMTDAGIVNPSRFAAMIAPGFAQP